MNTQNLIDLFERDLNKLVSELESYTSEQTLWIAPEGINNSAGNLALHLVGNLNHFIGTVLGETGYVREREAEFANKNIPKDKIVRDIRDTSAMISAVLADLDSEVLSGIYPIEVFGQPMTVEYFLIHLQSHLNYHLGQVNYHRRLLDQ